MKRPVKSRQNSSARARERPEFSLVTSRPVCANRGAEYPCFVSFWVIIGDFRVGFGDFFCILVGFWMLLENGAKMSVKRGGSGDFWVLLG